MHVVIVDGDISYPMTSGKRLRTLNLLLPLAARHNLTYIGRGDAKNPDMDLARQFLSDHGIAPILVDHPVPAKEGLSFMGRLAANAFSSLPFSVQSHHSEPMRQAVSSYAHRHAVDLWQFEWSAYLSTLSPEIKSPRLLMAHNVDTVIWQRYHEHARGLLRRTFLKSQGRRFARFETRAFQQATRVVAVSPDDANLIRDRFGQDQVDIVENGIDREYFNAIEPRRDPRQILFLGALDWRPNLDAVHLLLERIFPEVVRQEPRAKLTIVGRHPPAKLIHRIDQCANVEIHADVPDVRPFLATSGVMAVPLRIGGGSRLKILEALACGLPVTSSRVGAEGLALEAGKHYWAAEEDEMAAALVLAIRFPAKMQALAQRGQAVVRRVYDWKALADKLEQVWERCVARTGSRRKQGVEALQSSAGAKG